MMMKMLEAGGLPPLKDDWRRPDDDNPGGYYEFERVKKIKDDTSWLDEANGKAVKMVSRLLVYLPQDRAYKVVFMRRKTGEMLRSQRAMLERSGENSNDVDDETMQRLFESHLEDIDHWINARPNVESLYVWYHEVLGQTEETARKVNDFLGIDLNIELMTATVDQSLYRNRQ